MKNYYFFLLLLLIHTYGFSQPKVTPSTTESIKKAAQKRMQMDNSSLLKNYPAISIGPIIQGGRVTDIEVFPSNTNHFLVAYASGGVFLTRNNGISFDPIFDHQGSLTVGDLALFESESESLIWVGTGENNSSRSSYTGSGIYKSSDMGQTWISCGLEGSQHIGKIITHPTNPNTVWVAVMGALYSKNENRGIFKTTDGGKNWSKTLFVDDVTGAIDLIIHPKNPDILWASMWERSRKAWEFIENGPGSGIHKSTDGGLTWNKSQNGLPNGHGNGRIGLTISKSNPDVLYAILDNQMETRTPKEIESKSGMQPSDFNGMSNDQFYKIQAAVLDTFLREYDYPSKYSSSSVRNLVKTGELKPSDLALYFDNSNNDLFNTKVSGAEVYRSNDAGNSWKKTHESDLEGVFYTYGYYFGEIRVSPSNPEELFILGVPLLKSIDGGESFSYADTFPSVHGDHQALWINPNDDKHLRLGSDGGIYQSYDGGERWLPMQTLSVGQFYSVEVDMDEPYNVYGGLQDNGVNYGSSRSVPNRSKKWEWVMWGDGMMVQVNSENSDEIYTGFQFGNYYRLSRSGSFETSRITPVQELGEAPPRYNWRTPILLSKHNPSILYIGSQKLYQSLDKGETWNSISGDLTSNYPSENVPYSTLTVIEESPFSFNTLFIGTDDGNLQVTTNGGSSWENRIKGLPKGRWVSSIFPSTHKKKKLFVTLTGYRFDEFSPFVFISNDLGKTWTSISDNLPEEAINKLIEDHNQEGLLFLGTDHGAYTSINDGESWIRLSSLPNVAVYDLKIHPREPELILATHGRSMYRMDISHLREIALNKGSDLLFDIPAISYSEDWGKSDRSYEKPVEPQVSIRFYNSSINAEILVKDSTGTTLYKNQSQLGYQIETWNLKPIGSESYIQPGEYAVELKAGDQKQMTNLRVK